MHSEKLRSRDPTGPHDRRLAAAKRHRGVDMRAWHAPDVTNLGTDPEFEDFDMWLDDLKHRYKHGIYVVTGTLA